MPLVSSSASPGPLLWLMGLNALSPALLVHTALPLPEILSSPPLCVPLADFCTALQPSIADTSSVKPSQRGQGRGSLLLACCSLFLQPHLVWFCSVSCSYCEPLRDRAWVFVIPDAQLFLTGPGTLERGLVLFTCIVWTLVPGAACKRLVCLMPTGRACFVYALG